MLVDQDSLVVPHASPHVFDGKYLQTWLVSPSQMRMVYMGVSIATGVLWNGFTMENPSINGWFGGSSISGNLHITYKTGWWMCDVDTSSSSMEHFGHCFSMVFAFSQELSQNDEELLTKAALMQAGFCPKIAVWPAQDGGYPGELLVRNTIDLPWFHHFHRLNRWESQLMKGRLTPIILLLQLFT